LQVGVEMNLKTHFLILKCAVVGLIIWLMSFAGTIIHVSLGGVPISVTPSFIFILIGAVLAFVVIIEINRVYGSGCK
jgi:hypothetical protein